MSAEDAPMSDLEARQVITLQARRIAGDTAGRDVDLLDSEVGLPDGRSWLVVDLGSHIVVTFHGLSLPQLAACMVLGESQDSSGSAEGGWAR